MPSQKKISLRGWKAAHGSVKCPVRKPVTVRILLFPLFAPRLREDCSTWNIASSPRVSWNAINVGLPVFEVPELEVNDLSEVRVDAHSGEVTDLSTGRVFTGTRMPPVMSQILAAGGLQAYLAAGGDYTVKE